MMLHLPAVLKETALRTLRETVGGKTEDRIKLLPPEPLIIKPTEVESLEFAAISQVLQTTLTPEEVKEFASTRATLFARRSGLDKDCIEAVLGNISDMHEMIKDFVAVVGVNHEKASQTMEDLLACAGRTLVLLRRSCPVTDHQELRESYRRQSRELLMASLKELLEANLRDHMRNIPKDEREAFAAKANGFFSLFLEPPRGRSH